MISELRERFRSFTANQLRSTDLALFERQLKRFVGAVDGKVEGYDDTELKRQRDLSVKFHWGHDHDFGAFKMEGRMGERHLQLIADFSELFDVGLDFYRHQDVFDIGCWTGGTTLALSMLDARVVAIEEVRKYVDAADFLLTAFGLEEASVHHRSLYECSDSYNVIDKFDIVYFPGVLYHVSDPVIALRIIFNALRSSGALLLESTGINVDEPLCRFEGSMVHAYEEDAGELSRGGWNWFLPSPSALRRMLKEVGFTDIETMWHPERERVFAYARKEGPAPICRAGLSVPNIP